MTTMTDYVTRVTACGDEHNYTLATDTLSASNDIRRDYREGHYFDADTLRWFGSRNFATVAPGATVELQSNAPGDRYRVQVWRDSESGPSPWIGCYHATRSEAVSCARATADSLR